MLRIFIKYGKPLENNMEKLIKNKLIEIFEQEEENFLNEEMKNKFY